jgi:superfamily II DNA/RNA helicase
MTLLDTLFHLLFGRGKFAFIYRLNICLRLFVGGTEVTQDIQLLKKGCQIAIGTCGRIAQLLSTKVLNLKEVQLCVLDEADKLMEADFIKHVK